MLLTVIILATIPARLTPTQPPLVWFILVPLEPPEPLKRLVNKSVRVNKVTCLDILEVTWLEVLLIWAVAALAVIKVVTMSVRLILVVPVVLPLIINILACNHIILANTMVLALAAFRWVSPLAGLLLVPVADLA